MTHHDHLDRDLPAWLADDAARPVPSGLLDAIVADSHSRRQQPAWLVSLRGESMGTVSPGSSRALRIALVVVLVAVAAMTAVIAAGILQTQPQPNSPLAFIRGGDVYLAESGGTQTRLVLHQDGVRFSTVAWSPAGDRLALDGESGVVILDVASGHTTPVDGHNPVWSPDGSTLAVLGGGPGQGDGVLRLIDAETLTIRAAYPLDPIGGLAWSPNGRWIAATGGGERSNAVLRLDVATGEVVQIGPSSGHLDSLKQVSWSPDSSAIAFIRYANAEAGSACFDSAACSVDVFVGRADGSNMVRVNGLQGQANMPRWSPDGAWLAFRRADFSRGDQPLGISVVRPDGTGERTVIDARVAAYLWSPAGDRLLFARSDGLNPAELWETTLTGQARSLGLVVDIERTFVAGTGITFDLQTTGP